MLSLPNGSQVMEVKIHEDPDLEDCNKVKCLIQSVEPSRCTRQPLEKYAMTSVNYSKAVAVFQVCFGNKNLLIEVKSRNSEN